MEKDKFLNVFLSELPDLQKDMRDNILILEVNRTDFGALKNIYRLIHTLKSNAHFFDLIGLKIVTDKAEDFLSILCSQDGVIENNVLSLLWEIENIIERNIEAVKAGTTFESVNDEESLLIKKMDDVIYQFNKSQVNRSGEYRKTDSIRYVCLQTDITRHVFVMQDFLEKAKGGLADERMSKKFLTCLDELIEIFERNNCLAPARVFKQMSSDFMMLTDDSGVPNSFLVSQLQDNFDSVMHSLQKTEVPAGPLTCKQVSESIKEVKTSFRIEENKIDEVMGSLRKFDDLNRAFAAVRDKLVQAKAPADVILDLQKSINNLSYLSRDTLQMLVKIKVVSPKLLLEKVTHLIMDLANECRKKVAVEIKGDDVFIERTKLDALEKVMIHLVRNSIDHGIELPSQRLSLGKPEAGTISIEVAYTEENLVVSVGDDGQGIDIASLKESACKKSLITQEQFLNMSEAEAVRLLFLHGVSTANLVSDISGRGVGMDTVLDVITKAGGRIDVLTESGKGTVFTLILPKK